MSIHTDRSFNLAITKGSSAARTYETWKSLMGLSKRELAEIAIHLAALCSDEGYENSLMTDGALERVFQERDNLKTAGNI